MIARLHNVSRRRFKHWMSDTVRVTLSGADVTNRCFYADTRAGVVRCYKRNAAGQLYVVGMGNNEHVAREELHGSVRVWRRDRRRRG